jgi:hypothetical protein
MSLDMRWLPFRRERRSVSQWPIAEAMPMMLGCSSAHATVSAERGLSDDDVAVIETENRREFIAEGRWSARVFARLRERSR